MLREDARELRAAVEYHILRTKNNLIEHMERLKNTRSYEE